MAEEKTTESNVEQSEQASEHDYQIAEVLHQDVLKHGEAHVIVDEHDSVGGEDSDHELEVRKGTTVFDYDVGLITIEGADTIQRIGMDAIVRWYLPKEYAH